MANKTNILLVSLFFVLFLACSGTKTASQKSDKQVRQRSKDSLALAILEKDTASQKEKSEDKIDFDTSSVNFTVAPSDSFNLAGSNFLKLQIQPKKNMQDLYYKWKDPRGEYKKYKQVTNMKNMSPREVKRKIGRGKKKITAFYHFSGDYPPIERAEDITIYSKQETDEIIKKNKKEKSDTSVDRSKDTAQKSIKSSLPGSISKEINLVKKIFFDDIFFDRGEWQLPSTNFNSKYWLTFNKILKLLKTDSELKIILIGSVDSKEYQSNGLQLGLKRAATIGELIQKLYQKSEREQIGKKIYIDSTRKFKFSNSNQRTKLLNRAVSITFSMDSVKDRIALYKYHNTEQEDQHIQVRKDSVAQENVVQDMEEQYNKARELFISNKYDDALKIFRKLVNNQPQHRLADNAQWWIGEIFYMRENYIEAIPKYEKIFNLGDKNKAAYAQYRIGCCYYKVSKYDKAIRELKKVSAYSNASEVKKKARFTMKRAIEEKSKM